MPCLAPFLSQNFRGSQGCGAIRGLYPEDWEEIWALGQPERFEGRLYGLPECLRGLGASPRAGLGLLRVSAMGLIASCFLKFAEMRSGGSSGARLANRKSTYFESNPFLPLLEI